MFRSLKSMIGALGILCGVSVSALESEHYVLDVISYEDFVKEDSAALNILKGALYKNGIIGIRGIPGFRDKLYHFIDAARGFSALPEQVKESYAPNHGIGEMFLGYQKGKEKFQRPDGRWVVDDLKTSYYAFVPDSPINKWPREVDLRAPMEDLGGLMSEMGEAVMQKIGLSGRGRLVITEDSPRMGRMLYYRLNESNAEETPFWCGAHFDHGLFTVLTPAQYFMEGVGMEEPAEAGLFVRSSRQSEFWKVASNDPEVLLFQVGEFGQLLQNDAIRATEHRVHKAVESVERYAMALFFDAPMDAVVHSTSELTRDTRYGGGPGDPCTFRHWHEASFKRYIVKEEEP